MSTRHIERARCATTSSRHENLHICTAAVPTLLRAARHAGWQVSSTPVAPQAWSACAATSRAAVAAPKPALWTDAVPLPALLLAELAPAALSQTLLRRDHLLVCAFDGRKKNKHDDFCSAAQDATPFHTLDATANICKSLLSMTCTVSTLSMAGREHTATRRCAMTRCRRSSAAEPTCSSASTPCCSSSSPDSSRMRRCRRDTSPARVKPSPVSTLRRPLAPGRGRRSGLKIG